MRRDWYIYFALRDRARALALYVYPCNSHQGVSNIHEQVYIYTQVACARSLYTYVYPWNLHRGASNIHAQGRVYIYTQIARVLMVKTNRASLLCCSVLQCVAVCCSVLQYIRKSHACFLCIHMCIRVNSNRGASNIHEQEREHTYTYRARAHTHTLSLYIRLSVWI